VEIAGVIAFAIAVRVGIPDRLITCSHQEDFYAFSALSLDPEELRISVKASHGLHWDPTAVDALAARQVLFVGIYDGYDMRFFASIS
jgi:protein phosphatase PTC6